jgi:hypothetical protein
MLLISSTQHYKRGALQARFYLASSSIGDIVAFGGGWNGSTYYSVVDMLNVTSHTWFTVNLSQPRAWLASTSSTNKIFFGGGYNRSSGLSNLVDIFEIPLRLQLHRHRPHQQIQRQKFRQPNLF